MKFKINIPDKCLILNPDFLFLLFKEIYVIKCALPIPKTAKHHLQDDLEISNVLSCFNIAKVGKIILIATPCMKDCALRVFKNN